MRPWCQADQKQFLACSLKHPNPATLAQYSGSGRQFVGLPTSNCVVVATARDPTSYEYSGALRQATDQWASIVIHSGGSTVTPAEVGTG